jgi:hypothetical protein
MCDKEQSHFFAEEMASKKYVEYAFCLVIPPIVMYRLYKKETEENQVIDDLMRLRNAQERVVQGTKQIGKDQEQSQ